MTFIATFGYNQKLQNCYCRVEADSYQAAMREMYAIYGPRWSNLYTSEEAAGVMAYNLREVKFGTPNE